MSIRRAPIVHGVPCILFYDRHFERASHGTKPGPKPHLNASKEKELCNFVCEIGKIRYWHLRHDNRSRMLLKQFPKRKALSERTRYLIDGLGDSWTEIRCFFYTKETQLPLCE